MQAWSKGQLYALMNNRKLQPFIRQKVVALWEQRNIGIAEEQQVVMCYQRLFQQATKKWYIPLAVLFPLIVFAFPLQALVSARLLKKPTGNHGICIGSASAPASYAGQ